MIQFYILAGIMIAAITFTLCVTSIFGWLRELIAKIHPKLEELIFCPWCTGFWATLIFIATSDNALILQFYKNQSLNALCTVFIILGIAGLVHYVLLRAYEPVQKVMMMRHQEKMQALRKSNS
jgi:hypothetical protein